MTTNSERAARPLPASLRAIEAQSYVPFAWHDITEADLPESHLAVVGASTADLDFGGVWLAAASEPLRVCPGHLWHVLDADETVVLAFGIAPTLAEAKTCAEAAGADLAASMLREGNTA